MQALHVDYLNLHNESSHVEYICPKTGAHFNFAQICSVLDRLRRQRGDPDVEQLPVQREGEVT
jgi:hypothetical protein